METADDHSECDLNGINYDADDEGHLMPPPSGKFLEEKRKKKLETPLAAMLPSKYADVDVTELFPDFRCSQVRVFLILLILLKYLCIHIQVYVS